MTLIQTRALLRRGIVRARTLLILPALALFSHLFAARGEVPPVRAGQAQQQSDQDNSKERAQEKLRRVVENGSKSPVPPQTTVFSEEEVNQLLRVEMKEFIPPGIADPYLRLVGNNALLGRATVDLDEYKRRRQQRGGLDPLQLLSGRLPVTARGLLHTRDGRGQIMLQAADVNGIPLPPALVREIIAVLTRREGQPNGYDIEQPFVLPANIRAIDVESGKAAVIQ
jgi:hypothetical protein